jgi:type IV secretory pathway TrbD component
MLQVTMDVTALGGVGVCIAALASLIWAVRRDPKSGK